MSSYKPKQYPIVLNEIVIFILSIARFPFFQISFIDVRNEQIYEERQGRARN
jgi:hypothetical protein